MTESHTNRCRQKLLGKCLVEAGLLTSNQLEIALDEQNFSDRSLEEIFTMHGWIEQQTIDFFMEKVDLQQLALADTRQLVQKDNTRQNVKLNEKFNQTETLNLILNNLQVYISPKNTLRFLLLLIIGLCIVSLAGQFTLYFLPDYPSRGFFAELFNVDGEQNIPALYSAYALLFCSFLLFIIAYAKKIADDSYFRYWKALSIIFVFLSLDEFISLHEKLIEPLRKILKTSGFLYYAWVIPGAIFVLICLLAFWRFIAALPAKTRRLSLIAGTVFISGTIGIEMINGYYVNFYGRQYTYSILTTIEEFLEMLGIVVFIYALLSYICTYMKGMSLNIIINHNKQHFTA
ncbi:hypothetical protein [Fischerella sp. PCC 9605]|uniref:hypothetical protein n=1 Tax=Fischerella sp. PCC 9605 TaxID=1173024 RepID=UPI00047DB9B1